MTLRRLKSGIAPATAFDDFGAGQIDVEAPAGFVAASTGLHFTSYDYGDGKNGPAPTRSDALERALEDWLDGVVECPTVDCEVCQDRRADGAA